MISWQQTALDGNFQFSPIVLLLLSHPSHVRLCVSLWTVAHQAPLSMEFSRQEYRSGLPCPPPGDGPNPGIESRSPALEGEFFTTDPRKNHPLPLPPCPVWYDKHFCFCCSIAKSCPTLYDPMDCNTPGSSVIHCLLEFAQIHIHWVGDAI